MKTRTHFAHRIDMWDDAGENLVEHLAGVEDHEVAEATHRAAAQRWPGERITLQAGVRIIRESGQEEPDDPDEIDRHPPLGYYNYAASYHVGADMITERGLRATHPAAPAEFLYYHAIELYLKAVLRLHGTSPARLRKIGHDYRALCSRAELHGLKLGDVASEVLDVMAEGDVWSRARYLEVGSMQRPTLDALRKTSREIRQWAANALKAAGVTVRMPPHKISD